MTELETFRSETRAWLEREVPKSLHGLPMALPSEVGDSGEAPDVVADRARYLKLMAERGYTVPTWPKAYGGGGLSPDEARVLQEELGRLKLAPALVGMGVTMIGPTLLVHGNEEQKREYLPKIASGEHRWCQGFSEPGAGSDLASLRTGARLDDGGEHYVINGSKIWTSGAHVSNWMFLLVRTDDTQKHNGITFLLLDMTTPGIEVKPIRLLSGISMFCEVFFNDVKAKVSDVVGPVNGGWSIAKTLLNFERSGMGTGSLGGGPRRTSISGARIAQLAKETAGENNGQIADPSLRDRIAALLLDELALSLTVQRAAATRKTTGAFGPEMSMFKLVQSEIGQRRDELSLSLRGSEALAWDGAAASGDHVAQTRMWLSAKATTIYGGSSEIQRNIIAKRILRLPSSSS
jgi:alkylation response protein AidB-like acyl-CoA dehydrogenase